MSEFEAKIIRDKRSQEYDWQQEEYFETITAGNKPSEQKNSLDYSGFSSPGLVKKGYKQGATYFKEKNQDPKGIWTFGAVCKYDKKNQEIELVTPDNEVFKYSASEFKESFAFAGKMDPNLLSDTFYLVHDGTNLFPVGLFLNEEVKDSTFAIEDKLGKTSEIRRILHPGKEYSFGSKETAIEGTNLETKTRFNLTSSLGGLIHFKTEDQKDIFGYLCENNENQNTKAPIVYLVDPQKISGYNNISQLGISNKVQYKENKNTVGEEAYYSDASGLTSVGQYQWEAKKKFNRLSNKYVWIVSTFLQAPVNNSNEQSLVPTDKDFNADIPLIPWRPINPLNPVPPLNPPQPLPPVVPAPDDTTTQDVNVGNIDDAWPGGYLPPGNDVFPDPETTPAPVIPEPDPDFCINPFKSEKNKDEVIYNYSEIPHIFSIFEDNLGDFNKNTYIPKAIDVVIQSKTAMAPPPPIEKITTLPGFVPSQLPETGLPSLHINATSTQLRDKSGRFGNITNGGLLEASESLDSYARIKEQIENPRTDGSKTFPIINHQEDGYQSIDNVNFESSKVQDKQLTKGLSYEKAEAGVILGLADENSDGTIKKTTVDYKGNYVATAGNTIYIAPPDCTQQDTVGSETITVDLRLHKKVKLTIGNYGDTNLGTIEIADYGGKETLKISGQYLAIDAPDSSVGLAVGMNYYDSGTLKKVT